MRAIFGTNWKMRNVSHAQARSYVQSIITALPELVDVGIFIMPPVTLIRDMANERNGHQILLGAQNFHWDAEGEFTGEVSTQLLKQEGAEILLVGHAERRKVFGESDQIINRKLLRALSDDFRVVLCIGDSEEDMSRRSLTETFSRQVEVALGGVSKQAIHLLLIAYEPIWAIGQGASGAASPDRVAMTVEIIRHIICEVFGADGVQIPILYGGSVGLDNCQALLVKTGLDGLFVGRAASDPKNFVELMRRALEVVDSGRNNIRNSVLRTGGRGPI
jgi:triosephosphate isomerase